HDHVALRPSRSCEGILPPGLLRQSLRTDLPALLLPRRSDDARLPGALAGRVVLEPDGVLLDRRGNSAGLVAAGGRVLLPVRAAAVPAVEATYAFTARRRCRGTRRPHRDCESARDRAGPGAPRQHPPVHVSREVLRVLRRDLAGKEGGPSGR